VNEKLIVDILMSIGSLIGWLNKAYALKDGSTSWSRRSNLFNIVSFPVTALIPFYVLELWWTFGIGVLNFLTWIGIYVFRSPDEEDWLGRKVG